MEFLSRFKTNLKEVKIQNKNIFLFHKELFCSFTMIYLLFSILTTSVLFWTVELYNQHETYHSGQQPYNIINCFLMKEWNVYYYSNINKRTFKWTMLRIENLKSCYYTLAYHQIMNSKMLLLQFSYCQLVELLPQLVHFCQVHIQIIVINFEIINFDFFCYILSVLSFPTMATTKHTVIKKKNCKILVYFKFSSLRTFLVSYC